jgi:signal transduction histidine kinase
MQAGYMSETDSNSETRRERALLDWIQQFAPYGVVILDKSFCIQGWNHWMEAHSGKLLRETVGKSLFDVYPDLAARNLVGHFERAMLGESSVLSTSLHEYLLPMTPPLRENGVDKMRQTARISPLMADSQVSGIVMVIEDVTQRESQAEILQRQHRRDEILSWALSHFLKSEEPRKTIRLLFFKIAEHMDFDTFLLYIRDVETGMLNLSATGGIPVELEAAFSKYPVLSKVTESEEMVIFNSIRASTEADLGLLKDANASAAIAIPLFANDRQLGLICFATWSRDTILKEEADLLATIAQYLAAALDRENTNQQLQKAKVELSNHARLLEQKVEERTLRLKETVSELETFSYTLAHDLKAPARGISGYCQVLLEDYADVLPPDAKDIIQKLEHAPRRMEALIRDLLEFSKVSRQNVTLSETELEPILEDLLAMRGPDVRSAVTIVTPLHPVKAHKALLQQVLGNLIDNAIKFVNPDNQPNIEIRTEIVGHKSPSARGSLLFSSEDIDVLDKNPAAEPSKQIKLSVVDKGIGIAPEAHQKIFGIFERGLNADSYEGTGMGLAIVARAMQKMKGSCGVESKPGEGSQFWIELPAA